MFKLGALVRRRETAQTSPKRWPAPGTRAVPAVVAVMILALASVPVAGQVGEPGRAQATAEGWAAPEQETIVRCDPEIVYAYMDEIATIYLYVQDVEGLNAVDLWLTFNTGVGNVVDEDVYAPGIQIQPIYEFLQSYWVVFKSADNELGQVHYTATQMGELPKTGSGRLAMVRFQGLGAPGTITLQYSLLHDLSDINGQLIPNTTRDCQIFFSDPTCAVLKRFGARSWPCPSITLEWATFMEVDLLGFNLYRADSRDGVRTQLNDTLIPCQHPGQGVGAEYSWQDDTTEMGATYYYWLELVGPGGEVAGPVVIAAFCQTFLPFTVR